MQDLHYRSLIEISGLIRSRALSAEEVTLTLLARIDRHEPALRSATMVLHQSALAEARRADAEIAAGLWRGPLHGIPIGVKDLLWTRGLPTSGGMTLLSQFVPEQDATVVRRLREAGAVIIAKLHMTEGATVEHHPELPRPANPWHADHWTGVSSSGSGVAAAAGFCFGAIGSDTGGSIRMPSSANNLTGIKPTWGRVSRHGLLHLSESLDHLGPMARSVDDAAAILQAIAGHDPDDPTSLSEPVPDYLGSSPTRLDGLRIGIDWAFAAGGLPDEVVACLREGLASFEALGARVREILFPWSDEDFAATIPIFTAEVALAHAPHFPAKAEHYGRWFRTMLEEAHAGCDPLAVANAYVLRDRYRGRLRALFRDVDIILTPGLGKVLPTWTEMEAAYGGDAPFDMDLVRFTVPMNMAGVPTLSLPGGFSSSGLPIGIQLTGRWLEETTLIAAGRAFQRVTDWHTRHPALDS